ncbi:MAG: hypothetical protein ACOYXM_18215 [Actinomycetota bacterium]
MTSEDEVPGDAIVRTALQLLPVPEHGDTFWLELDALLDLEPARSTPGRDRAAATRVIVAAPAVQPIRMAPAPAMAAAGADPALALVPVSLRRRSNAVLSAVAVTAAVLVFLAGTSLVRQRSDGGGGAQERIAADGGAAVLASTSTSAVASDDEAVTAEEAVLAWVRALSQGDTSTAWDLMGSSSRAHFGSRSGYESEADAVAETYAGWATSAPEDVLVTSLVSSGDGVVVVVTMVGAGSSGDPQDKRAQAVPVRIVDGVALLEPFAFAGEIEVVVPEVIPDDPTKPSMGTGEELIVVVPRGVGAPTIRLDDGDPLVCGEAPGTELTELDEAPGRRCSYKPSGGIPAGDRVLTVGFLAADGNGIAAESVLFEAA